MRVQYPGAWYHVMNRGRRREKIYFCDKDREDYLKILYQCKKLYQLELHAYSLMPNHYHLLIRTPRGNISRIMRHIDGIYTQRVNKRYNLDGGLFRGRYKSIIVGGEGYLKKILQYIHMNPVKAKMCKRPEEHPWTSHRFYLGKEKGAWIETEFLISQFGNYRREAVLRLDRYVKTDEDGYEMSRQLDKKRWPAILGSKEFKEKVRGYLSGKQIEKKEMYEYKEIEKTVGVEDVLRVLTEECGILREDIYQSRRGIRAYGRRSFIYLLRRYTYKSCQEISNNLGDIGYKAVSRQYRIAEDEIKMEKGCYKVVSKAEDCIVK